MFLHAHDGGGSMKYYCEKCGSYFEYKLPQGVQKNKKVKIAIALSMLQNSTLDPSAVKRNSDGYIISVTLHYARIKPYCPKCLSNDAVVHVSQIQP